MENGIVLVIGLAGAMVWLSAEAVEVGSSDPWEVWIWFPYVESG